MRTLAFIALGFFVACAIGATAGILRRPPRTVDLTPTSVMVFVSDTSEGATLSSAMVREASFPATYVSESMVRPADWSRLEGRKIVFAAQAGDPLTWQHFARLDRKLATERCILALHAGVEAAAEQRIETELEAMQVAELAPVAGPTAPPGPTVRVVGLAKDLHEGAELTAASLQIIEVPVAFVTESLILEHEQPSIIGAKLVAELQAGDPITWTILQRDTVIGANTCVTKLTAATKQARAEFAKKAVTTFEAGEKP